MHSKTILFFITSFFAVFVTANYPPATTTVTVTAPAATVTTVSQCNTGTISCCNSIQSASSAPASLLLGLLGIVLSDVSVLVGLGCTPISLVGIGPASCSAQAVCCTGNSFNGLINLGCNAINL